MNLKNLLLSACCLFAAYTSEAKKIGYTSPTFTPAEEEFMNRRRAVKRERITIGTNEYWVVTYMKGAKLDGVKTNLAYKIEGVPQTNPTEEDAKWTRKVAKDAENAEKHDQKNYENWLKDTEKAKRKSSEAMLPFYEDIIFFATNRVRKVEK